MKRSLLGTLLFLLASTFVHAATPIYTEDNGSRYYFVRLDTPTYPNFEIRLTSNGVAATGQFGSGGFGGGSFFGYYVNNGVVVGPANSTALFGGSGDAECYGRISSVFYPFIGYKCYSASGVAMFTSVVTSKLNVRPSRADIIVDTLGAEAAIKSELQRFMPGDAIPTYYSEIGARWIIHSIRGNDVELELPSVFDTTTNSWKNVIVFLQGFLPALTSVAQGKLTDPTYVSNTRACVNTTDSDYSYCGGKAPLAPW